MVETPQEEIGRGTTGVATAATTPAASADTGTGTTVPGSGRAADEVGATTTGGTQSEVSAVPAGGTTEAGRVSQVQTAGAAVEQQVSPTTDLQAATQAWTQRAVQHISGNENLMAEMTALETTPEQYAGNLARLLTAFAQRIAPNNPADFLGRYDIGAAVEGTGSTIYNAPLNAGVDLNAPIQVVDLSGTKPLSINNQEAKEFVKKWKGAPLEIGTDANGKITVRLSTRNPEHPFWSSDARGRYETNRRAALADLEKVLAGAVRIEDIAPKHKGIGKTIRFYVPVSRGGGSPATLRIVAHELSGQMAEIDGVELYDIIKEKRQPSPSGQATGGTGTSVGGVGQRSSSITIREMLSGVKDAQGNVYQQSALHASPNRFAQFSLAHIGSGEGAQVHGWGLYFFRNVTEKRRRLNDRRYRQNLESPRSMAFRSSEGVYVHAGNNESVWIFYPDDGSDPFSIDASVEEYPYLKALWEGRGDAGWAENIIARNYADKNNVSSLSRAVSDERDRFREFYETLSLTETGQQYLVEIPDDDVLLHQDLPLSRQPKSVVDSIANIFDVIASESEAIDAYYAEDFTRRYDVNRVYRRRFHDVAGFDQPIDYLRSQKRGKDFYGALSDILGSDRLASKFLNEHGIEGIAYHGGIDGPGAVIFNDKAIDIIKTYYQNQARGQVAVRDLNYLVTLFENADLSTLVHESGHIFFEEMEAAVNSGAADASLTTDYQTVRDWLGVQEGETANREQREKFARGFEQYLREGKAPTSALQTVFERFKAWLTAIYKSAADLNVELTDEVRAVFDRLLGAQPQPTEAGYGLQEKQGQEEKVVAQEPVPVETPAQTTEADWFPRDMQDIFGPLFTKPLLMLNRTDIDALRLWEFAGVAQGSTVAVIKEALKQRVDAKGKINWAEIARGYLSPTQMADAVEMVARATDQPRLKWDLAGLVNRMREHIAANTTTAFTPEEKNAITLSLVPTIDELMLVLDTGNQYPYAPASIYRAYADSFAGTRSIEGDAVRDLLNRISQRIYKHMSHLGSETSDLLRGLIMSGIMRSYMADGSNTIAEVQTYIDNAPNLNMNDTEKKKAMAIVIDMFSEHPEILSTQGETNANIRDSERKVTTAPGLSSGREDAGIQPGRREADSAASKSAGISQDGVEWNPEPVATDGSGFDNETGTDESAVDVVDPTGGRDEGLRQELGQGQPVSGLGTDPAAETDAATNCWELMGAKTRQTGQPINILPCHIITGFGRNADDGPGYGASAFLLEPILVGRQVFPRVFQPTKQSHKMNYAIVRPYPATS